MSRKYTEEDDRLRQCVVDCDGRLKEAAELYGVTYSVLRNRLRTHKHMVWWMQKKKEYSRLRHNARQKKAYHRRKEREARRWGVPVDTSEPPQRPRGRPPSKDVLAKDEEIKKALLQFEGDIQKTADFLCMHSSYIYSSMRRARNREFWEKVKKAKKAKKEGNLNVLFKDIR